LPDAAGGRAGLAELAEGLQAEDEPDDDAGASRTGPWDFVAEAGPWLRRGAACVAAFALAWAGLTGAPVGLVAALVGSALVAAAAFAAPGLGLGLALLLLLVGTALQTGWLAALLFAPVFAALWWFGGRKGTWAFIAPLFAPALGMARLAPISPLLFGFFMNVVPAALASAFAAALTMLASAASGYGPPVLKVDPYLALDPWATIAAHGVDFRVLLAPGTVLAVAGWAAAGAVVALIARGGGRPRGLVAVVTGAGILLVTYWAWSATGAFAWPGTELLVQLGFSLFLASCMALLGAPPELGEE
jgi:hypothetical protein